MSLSFSPMLNLVLTSYKKEYEKQVSEALQLEAKELSLENVQADINNRVWRVVEQPSTPKKKRK